MGKDSFSDGNVSLYLSPPLLLLATSKRLQPPRSTYIYALLESPFRREQRCLPQLLTYPVPLRINANFIV